MFYFLCLFGLLAELYALSDLERMTKISDIFKGEVEKKTEGELCLLVFLNIGYAVWTLIGLFTVHWLPALFIFLLSMIPKKKKWWVFTDAIIGIGIILFTFIGGLHFDLNTSKLIIDWALNFLA